MASETRKRRPRGRTIYMLRCRWDDASEWGPPTAYETRRERDNDEKLNRCLGGIRTHSYEVRMDESVGSV